MLPTPCRYTCDLLEVKELDRAKSHLQHTPQGEAPQDYVGTATLRCFVRGPSDTHTYRCKDRVKNERPNSSQFSVAALCRLTGLKSMLDLHNESH